jgi:cyclophilin family peptidyl-prolyl cis-trans isomerase
MLDLGFFAGIQTLFHKGVPNNVEEIMSRVEKAYQDYPVDRSNSIFLTQRGCMMEVMKQNGGKYYDIPHMRKKTLEM